MVQLTAATPERELRQPVMRMSRPGRCALSRQLGSVTLTQSLSDFVQRTRRIDDPFVVVERGRLWEVREISRGALLPSQRNPCCRCHRGEPYGPAQPSRAISSMTASWRFERLSKS